VPYRLRCPGLTTAFIVLLPLSCAPFVGCHREAARPERSANLLLITVDATRPDRLGCYGDKDARTPAIDRLAKTGVVFEQAFANVPICLPSYATMMTGLLPPEHGVRINGWNQLDIEKPTLAETLQGRGYQTGAFVASVNLLLRYGLNRGFDSYDDDLTKAYQGLDRQPEHIYRPGNVVTDGAIQWLRERKPQQPFFCWAQYSDPQSPPHSHPSTPETSYEGLSGYAGEITFMDAQIGRLLDYLEAEGLAETTLVVLAGSRGEAFGEHGESGSGYSLYESTLRVPLIVSMPTRPPQGFRSKALQSTVDLMPTLLDLLGIEKSDERTGKSFAAGFAQGEVASAGACYSETELPYVLFRWRPLKALRTERWTYIAGPEPLLYDRQADANEENNQAAAQPAVVEQLQQQLENLLTSMAMHRAARVERRAEEVAHLAALGYLATGFWSEEEPPRVDAPSLDSASRAAVLERVRQARAFTGTPNTQGQMAMLMEAWSMSPESPAIRSMAGVAMLKAGRAEEGLKELLAYLALAPDDADAYCNMAMIYSTQKNLGQVVRFLTQAIRIKPDHAVAHNVLGQLLQGLGDAAGAARHASPGELTIPIEALAHYDMGVALSREGKSDEAVAELNKALELAGDDPLTHFAYAMILERKGDLPSAEAQYAEAIRLGVKEPKALLALGSIQGAQGKLAEAVESVSMYLDIVPEDAIARMNLGYALQELGREAEAAEQFNEVLRLQPNSITALRALGDMYLNQNDFARATHYYRKWVEADPADVSARKALAFSLDRKGDSAEAADLLRKIVDDNPDEAQAWYMLGTILQARWETEEAIRAYREALRFGHGYTQPAGSLAWILATHPQDELRNGAEAVELAKMACESNEYKDLQSMDALAAAYAEVGLYTEAVETARKALELARAIGIEPLVDDLEARLGLYEAGKPYREGPPVSSPASQPSS